MSECNHDCSNCSANCGSREPESLLTPVNEYSRISKVIGVVSGKGGVGKSMVTSLLAIAAQRSGLQAAILDSDITGPSIPKAFGLHDKVYGNEMGIVPAQTSTGIRVMSTNLILENEDDPVVWRGPVIGSAIKQFWGEVCWGDVDYMFVDMPPGTGDVALTVFQSLPVDGIIVVTSPQDLVSMIVGKAVKMAKLMNIPILGLVENYSYLNCPDCGKKIYVFGESKIEEVAANYGLEVLAKLPIDPKAAELCDAGKMEEYTGISLADVIEKL